MKMKEFVSTLGEHPNGILSGLKAPLTPLLTPYLQGIHARSQGISEPVHSTEALWCFE